MGENAQIGESQKNYTTPSVITKTKASTTNSQGANNLKLKNGEQFDSQQTTQQTNFNSTTPLDSEYKYIFSPRLNSPFAQITMAKQEYLNQYDYYKRGDMSEVDKTAFEAQGTLLQTYGYTLKDEKQADGTTIKKWDLSIDLNKINDIREANSEYLQKTIGYSPKQIKALSEYMLLEDLALTLIRTNNLRVSPGQAFVMSRTLATFPVLKDNTILNKVSPFSADSRPNNCIVNSLALSLASRVDLNSQNPDNEIKDLADAIQKQANLVYRRMQYQKKSEKPILERATEINPRYGFAPFPTLPGLIAEMEEIGYSLDNKKYSFQELKDKIGSKELPANTMIVMIDVGYLSAHAFNIIGSSNGKTYTSQVDGGITPYISNTIVETDKLFTDIENNPATQDTEQTAVYILRPPK